MAETMKIVAITGDHEASVIEAAKPEPGKGQIRMRVEGCALCTFEQRMFTGVVPVPLPFIGGHEVAGYIDAIGEGLKPENYPIGKRIAARTFYSCGHCYGCRHDEGNLCVNGSEQDKSWMAYPGIGGLEQYMLIKPDMLFFMNDDLPLEKACFAEPLACVLNSIEKGRIEIGDDVVVIGGGIMGQLHVMCSKLQGARVIMSEPDEARRQLAAELGADVCINPLECDAVEKVKELTDGNGAAVVFNTTAVSAVAQQAISIPTSPSRSPRTGCTTPRPSSPAPSRRPSAASAAPATPSPRASSTPASSSPASSISMIARRPSRRPSAPTPSAASSRCNLRYPFLTKGVKYACFHG